MSRDQGSGIRDPKVHSFWVLGFLVLGKSRGERRDARRRALLGLGACAPGGDGEDRRRREREDCEKQQERVH
jgi:hypothetical protein